MPTLFRRTIHEQCSQKTRSTDNIATIAVAFIKDIPTTCVADTDRTSYHPRLVYASIIIDCNGYRGMALWNVICIYFVIQSSVEITAGRVRAETFKLDWAFGWRVKTPPIRLPEAKGRYPPR
jgi:hypothetical protein